MSIILELLAPGLPLRFLPFPLSDLPFPDEAAFSAATTSAGGAWYSKYLFCVKIRHCETSTSTPWGEGGVSVSTSPFLLYHWYTMGMCCPLPNLGRSRPFG